MKKGKYWILLGLIFLIAINTAIAEKVKIETARKIANNWYKYHSTLKTQDFEEINVRTYSFSGQEALYIFEYSPTGFVIVSADNKAIPVLGYSFSSKFLLNEGFEPLNNWLDMYSKEIYEAGKNKSAETNPQWEQILNNRLKYSLKSEEVLPLVQTTWNQAGAYNNFTPVDNGTHTPAGCVIVAMAQIMKYWEHPLKGTGSSSYYHSDYGTLSANYDTTYYDWDNMPLHNSNDNIAFLLYQLGVSVKMNYGPDGSGSNLSRARTSFENYFDYKPGHIRLLTKANYSFDPSRYQYILKNELINGRPMEHRGSSETAGHAFVFDGYSGDYFHVNWGWGGSSDGYFTTAALGDYSIGQACLVGIQPSDVTIYDRPFDLTAAASNNRVYLKWTAVQLFGGYETFSFDHYNIYRDGVLIGNCEEDSYVDSLVVNGESYSYYVTSYYFGEESGESFSSGNVNGEPWPGFELPYFEDFEEGNQGWTILNSSYGFNWGDSDFLNMGDGNSSNYIGANSGTAGEKHVADNMTSCSLDLSQYSNVALKFDYVLRRWSDFDHLKVLYKNFESAEWIEIEDLKPTGNWSSWTTKALYLPEEALTDNVQIAFSYDDNNEVGYGAGIDNVYIYEVVNPPVPEFYASATELCVGNEVIFNDESTGEIDSYFWDFGSNATPSTADTRGPHTVTYGSAGNRTVSLILNNLDTNIKTDYLKLYSTPKANFIFYQNDPVVSFYDRSQNGLNYYWDFGDGTAGEGEDIEHIYESSGTYIVNEIVSNGYCSNDTAQQSVSVIGSGVYNPDIENIMTIFPNPSKGIFNLRLSTIINKDININIYNLSGEKVYQEYVSEMNEKVFHKVSLGNKFKGIYFIKISTGEKIITKKIVVQ
ncbi:C10 family peptidase [Bacteroidota bacterium]